MPVLPSAETMQRNLPRNTGGVPSVRGVGMPDTGEGIVSRALAQAGASLGEIDAKRQARENRLGMARAQTELVRTLHTAYQETDDAEYGTQLGRFSERVDKGVNEAAKHIADPEARQLFIADAESKVVEWTSRTHQRALGLERQHHVAELVASEDEMLARAASAPDSRAAAAVAGEYAERVKALVDVQALAPQEAAAQVRAFESKFAETRILALPPMQQVEVLKDPTKGLASKLTASTYLRLREGAENASEWDMAYAIVDAAGGQPIPDSRLQQMPADVRKLVEDMQYRREQRDFQREQRAEARRGKAEAEADYRTAWSIRAMDDDFSAQLDLVKDSGLPPERQQRITQLLTEQHRLNTVAEQDRLGEVTAALAKRAAGGESIAQIMRTSHAAWSQLSAQQHQIIEQEAMRAMGQEPVTAAESTPVFNQLLIEAEQNQQLFMSHPPEDLRAKLSDRHFATVMGMRGQLQNAMAATAQERAKQRGELVVSNAASFTRALRSGIDLAGIGENDKKQALYTQRFEREVAAARQSLDRELTIDELYSISERLSKELVLKENTFRPDKTKRAFEITFDDIPEQAVRAIREKFEADKAAGLLPPGAVLSDELLLMKWRSILPEDD